MNTFKYRGKRLPYTAGTGGATAGDVVAFDSKIGIVVADIAASGTGEVEVEGVHSLAALNGTGSANAFVQGDDLYWDTSESELTNVASSNVGPVGYAAEAKAAATTTVNIKLTG
tara:strand:- start:2920 stop:3261 length:342 start_codon:yes stop_codon:yes gene_type:complete